MLLKNCCLIIIAIVISFYNLRAQCPEDVLPGMICDLAPLVGCELDGYQGSNRFDNQNNLGFMPDEFCGIIENDIYFKFIASSEQIVISIIPSNCDNNLGLQAMLFTTNDCNSSEAISICASFGTPEQLNVVSQSVIVGSEVYLLIDGFEGDICDFTIEVILGVAEDAVVDSNLSEPCYMTVDVGYPLLRRCFSNSVRVKYCNKTQSDEEDVIIDIEMDEFLDFEGSSIPLLSQEGKKVNFNVGALEIGECGYFSFNVTPNCSDTELGQEHCIAARIYPDTICLDGEPDSISINANIELSLGCNGDTTYYEIANTGGASTIEEISFFEYIESKLINVISLSLEPGQIFKGTQKNSGKEYRIVVEQDASNPGYITGLSDCGSLLSPDIRITPFLRNPYTDVSCQRNIGSYDPNDKTAIPTGWGEEHFIPSDQDLEYKIRFQNTGTDTAFTVVIRDTIASELDMTTFNAGISSHAYNINIEDENILVFTFNNILLPDSTTNLVASNGFVEFSINQVEGNLPGTKIENTAAIYFDFNEAIITNTAFHTIETPLAYNVEQVELCANQMYNKVVYTKDTVLSVLHELPYLDSFEIVNIHVLPVHVEAQNFNVAYGTIVNNISLTVDTTILEYYTNSYGCDSTLVINYFVENPNAISSISKKHWSVFPNPTKGNLTIQTNQAFTENLYSVRVMNIVGQTVYQYEHTITPNKNISLDLKNLSAGTYLLNISSKRGMITEKIIINP